MNIKDYLKDRSLAILLNFIFFAFVIFILKASQVERVTIIFTTMLWIALSGIEIFYGYFKKKSYYDQVINSLNELDKKYLLPVVTKRPSFCEGKILYDVLSITDKSMNEEVNKYKFNQEEYREYLDLWVHEIKTPIAASKLVIENNKNEHTLSILEEIEKVENFIEQVLYYSKSNEVEIDYIIKETDLRKCINNTIKRNKKLIREKRICIDIQDFRETVYCDAKWMEFILNQIIVNSIKYIGYKTINKKLEKELPKISIYTKIKDNSLQLYIKDNGIGIDKKDLKKVFNKGFTGINGRKLKKSTGMGLYISKRLAQKMYLGLDIYSEVNEETTVKITFPKSNMIQI
ncbi:MAG: sensor histidine kinase [Paraclostridium sp.]